VNAGSGLDAAQDHVTHVEVSAVYVSVMVVLELLFILGMF
jgi:hypothetical protein